MKIIIVAVLIALLSMLVKHYKPEYAIAVQLSGVAVLLLYAANSLENVLASLESMIASSGLDISFLKILLKALAISILTDIASSICKDSGNSTLANAVDLLGKTLIVVLALPLIKKLAESAIGFIN